MLIEDPGRGRSRSTIRKLLQRGHTRTQERRIRDQWQASQRRALLQKRGLLLNGRLLHWDLRNSRG